MTEVHDWLANTTVLGISLTNVLAAVLVMLVSYLVLTCSIGLVLKRLSRLAGTTTTRIDDMLVETLSSTNRALMLLVSVLIGIGMLDLPDRWASRVSQLWFVALALQIALWANTAVSIGLRRHTEPEPGRGPRLGGASATLVSWGLRSILWAIVLLAMLSNLGVNVTAFVASLGVGGVAVALAAQSVLGDLFASVAIAVDKPFEVGDFIVLGSIAGTVEAVGVKTTRIRSLGGEQIVMSNSELLKQTVSNYKRLQQRRIVFGFSVTYETPADRLEEIAAVVKRIVSESQNVRFDRAHFKSFGESSLDYEVVYIVLSSDYNTYMDEQQRINIRLKREVEALNVAFARPVRTVVFADGGENPARVEAARRSAEPAVTGSMAD